MKLCRRVSRSCSWWVSPDVSSPDGAAKATTEVSVIQTERRNVCVGCDSHWLMGSAPWTGCSNCLSGPSAVCSLLTPSTTPSFCLAAHPAWILLCKSTRFSGESSWNQSANSASSDETGRNQSAKTHFWKEWDNNKQSLTLTVLSKTRLKQL